MITDAMIEAALSAFNKAVNDPIMENCQRCDGKGYHYGFGETGHDPDWCNDCGGGGVNVRPGEEERAMRAALEAALAAAGEPVAWLMPGNNVTTNPFVVQFHKDIAGIDAVPLYTAPPASPVRVKVRELEWVMHVIGDGTPLRQNTWAADKYYYQIVESPSGKFDLRRGTYAICDTLEAAKAAAQSDYERRILSALEPEQAGLIAATWKGDRK